eukprot:gnl/Chilomastix_cuspidata/2942.p1 GENE.gnl/Chilomastix_cuspidata/2942~~gnl/Chilomastix_cuspidata/2942.p1  ORF type:complete len:231 (+),score=30.92 gnl/Chilomastix_cuspidata/2942:97-693(+)
MLNIFIVGRIYVGRSCILKRFKSPDLKGILEDFPKGTIGVDFLTKTVVVDGTTVNLVVYDISSRYFSFLKDSRFFGSADGFLVVYSNDCQLSFQHTEDWLDVIAERFGDVPIVIVANKVDLPAAVPLSVARESAQERGFGFAEVSALYGTGVVEAFDLLVHMILAGEPKEHSDLSSTSTVELDDGSVSNSDGGRCGHK